MPTYGKVRVEQTGERQKPRFFLRKIEFCFDESTNFSRRNIVVDFWIGHKEFGQFRLFAQTLPDAAEFLGDIKQPTHPFRKDVNIFPGSLEFSRFSTSHALSFLNSRLVVPADIATFLGRLGQNMSAYYIENEGNWLG